MDVLFYEKEILYWYLFFVYLKTEIEKEEVGRKMNICVYAEFDEVLRKDFFLKKLLF